MAAKNWERPIYFASMMAPDSYMGLEDFFRLEGMAYRLVPLIRSTQTPNDLYMGWVGQDILYQRLTETFLYRGLDTDSYLDEHIRQVILGGSYFNTFFRLGLSYANQIQDAKAQLEVYQYVADHPGAWEDSLQLLVNSETSVEERGDPTPERVLALKKRLASEFLVGNKEPLSSLSEKIQSQEAVIQEKQAKIGELLSFLFEHIPREQVPYSYAEWAMMVQIYDSAGMPEELMEALEHLVEKGLTELVLIHESGRKLSPNEMAFSAVLMGMQYYQEAGDTEKAQELTKRLEAFLGE